MQESLHIYKIMQSTTEDDAHKVAAFLVLAPICMLRQSLGMSVVGVAALQHQGEFLSMFCGRLSTSSRKPANFLWLE